MTKSFTRGLSLQGLIATLGGSIWAVLGSASLAWGWGAGAAIAMAHSGLLVWRWSQGRRVFTSDPGRHVMVFYRSVIERYVLVMVLLAAVLGWLPGLDARTVLAGFVMGQVGWLAAALIWRDGA
jgi:hypothetical protein